MPEDLALLGFPVSEWPSRNSEIMWRPWRQWQQGNMSKFCLWVVDRPPSLREHLCWSWHVMLIACHFRVASRFWAFSKSPSVFSKRVICPGEVTPSHKWNCQSHGWQAFSVWENTSCLQGKSWCLAGQQRQVAKGSTSLEMLWSVNTPKTHMMGHISLSIKALRLTVGYTTEMVCFPIMYQDDVCCWYPDGVTGRTAAQIL